MDNSILAKQIKKIAQADLGETEERIESILNDFEKKVREDQSLYEREHEYV